MKTDNKHVQSYLYPLAYCAVQCRQLLSRFGSDASPQSAQSHGIAQKLVPVCQQRKPEDWDTQKCDYLHFNLRPPLNLFFCGDGDWSEFE